MAEQMTEEQIRLQRDQALAKVILEGDLSRLSDREKIQVYIERCNAAGLNWRTLPYDYLKLSGKETLFLNARGVSQLNNMHKIGHTIQSREQFVEGDDVVFFRVEARAHALDGRVEEAMGEVVLSVPEEVEEEFDDKGVKRKRKIATGKWDLMRPIDRSNARMKCETKAKERATKFLVGEGGLTESDIEAIPGAQIVQGPMPTEEMAVSLGYNDQVKGAIEDKGTVVETGTTIKISEPSKKVGIPKPVSGAKSNSAVGAQTDPGEGDSATNAQTSGSENASQTQSTASGQTSTSVGAKAAAADGTRNKPGPKPRQTSSGASPSKAPESEAKQEINIVDATEVKEDRPGEEQLLQIQQTAEKNGWNEDEASLECETFLRNRGIDLESLFDNWTWDDFKALINYFQQNKKTPA